MIETEKTSCGRLHGLDTLRAIAIVVVMLYHFNIQGLLPSVLVPFARIGWIGVDLFFVLSGFLIGSQLLKPYLSGKKLLLKDFYSRRAYRILPAFFVVLLLYLLVPLWREAAGPYAAWQYASFLWNLLLLGYPDSHVFSHVWSLCVEEHFYLLFPLMLLLLMRKPAVWKAVGIFLFVFVGGIGLRAWILHAIVLPAGEQQGLMMMKYLYYPTYTRLDGLLVGLALAVVRTFRVDWWARITRQSGVWAIAGIACVIGALWMCNFGYIKPELSLSILFAFPLLAAGFGMLVASAVGERGLMRIRVPGATAIAALAYSLYLTHKSVAHVTHQLMPVLTREANWFSLGVYVVTCLGVASVLYFAVERPFIALRVRRGTQQNEDAVENEVRLDPAV